jgi:hypothetical protein
VKALGVALLLVACGSSPNAEQPEPGWCCEGLCGLWAEETETFRICTCDAVVRRPEPGARGECLTDPAP